MKLRSAFFALTVGALVACSGFAAAATEGPGVLEGKSLLGKPLYTKSNNPVNVASVDALQRATAEAKAAYDSQLTVDSATWYGRLLAYQGLMRESIAVYSTALKTFPNSGKLLRHRAHRYFNLREFDSSLKDAVRAVAIYDGKPLEREKLGPKYFPSTPDVVQFYLYYHLGQAYFATHQYNKAAEAFDKSHQIGIGVNDASSITAATYWRYLSLARGQRYADAAHFLSEYDLTLLDLESNIEANYYFDGIQLFKNLRDPTSFYDNKDSGKAFSTADGMGASTAYTLANYYLLQGDSAKAKEFLWKSANVDTWSYFAVVQGEADWALLYPGEAL